MIVRFKCLGNLEDDIKVEMNLSSHDYFNPSKVNQEDFRELIEDFDEDNK